MPVGSRTQGFGIPTAELPRGVAYALWKNQSLRDLDFGKRIAFELYGLCSHWILVFSLSIVQPCGLLSYIKIYRIRSSRVRDHQQQRCRWRGVHAPRGDHSLQGLLLKNGLCNWFFFANEFTIGAWRNGRVVILKLHVQGWKICMAFIFEQEISLKLSFLYNGTPRSYSLLCPARYSDFLANICYTHPGFCY